MKISAYGGGKGGLLEEKTEIVKILAITAVVITGMIMEPGIISTIVVVGVIIFFIAVFS